MSKAKEKAKEMAKKMKGGVAPSNESGKRGAAPAPENESTRYKGGEPLNESRGKSKRMPERDEKESTKR
jgi:hypothetical protein